MLTVIAISPAGGSTGLVELVLLELLLELELELEELLLELLEPLVPVGVQATMASATTKSKKNKTTFFIAKSP
ncbi:MAG: hypothetical protein J6V82_03150 [Clostridia bacterium]|nr:hypothetical protein [Clostridia bacterium]